MNGGGWNLSGAFMPGTRGILLKNDKLQEGFVNDHC